MSSPLAETSSRESYRAKHFAPAFPLIQIGSRNTLHFSLTIAIGKYSDSPLDELAWLLHIKGNSGTF